MLKASRRHRSNHSPPRSIKANGEESGFGDRTSGIVNAKLGRDCRHYRAADEAPIPSVCDSKLIERRVNRELKVRRHPLVRRPAVVALDLLPPVRRDARLLSFGRL